MSIVTIMPFPPPSFLLSPSLQGLLLRCCQSPRTGLESPKIIIDFQISTERDHGDFSRASLASYYMTLWKEGNLRVIALVRVLMVTSGTEDSANSKNTVYICVGFLKKNILKMVI